MKKLVYFLIVSLLIVGCEKSKNTIGNQAYIYGSLSSENQFITLESQPRPVKKRLIYISDSPGDSTNFIYSIRTDSLGQFSFNGLNEDKSYLVFFKDTIKGNLYTVYQTLKPAENPQSLKATINSTNIDGVILKVTDSLGFPINSASIYLYRSKVVADSKNINGSIYQLKSDANGQALKTQLSTGDWFAYANFKSDSTFNLQGFGNFTINRNQTTSVAIVLKK